MLRALLGCLGHRVSWRSEKTWSLRGKVGHVFGGDDTVRERERVCVYIGNKDNRMPVGL